MVKADGSTMSGKPGMQSRTQAVVYALRNSMVSTEDIPL